MLRSSLAAAALVLGWGVAATAGEVRQLPLTADYCTILRAFTTNPDPRCPPATARGLTRSIDPSPDNQLVRPGVRLRDLEDQSTAVAAATARDTGYATDVATPALTPMNEPQADMAPGDGAPLYPSEMVDDHHHDHGYETTSPYAALEPVRPRFAAPRVFMGAAPAPAGEQGYFVRFPFDSDRLTPDYETHLHRLSAVLRSDAMARLCLKLVGHTDAVGDTFYNMALSEARADTVRRYLATLGGVHSSRIVVEGRGEQTLLPGVQANDPLHRRVEILAKDAGGLGCV